MAVTNTLAYCDTATITAAKCLIVQAPEVSTFFPIRLLKRFLTFYETFEHFNKTFLVVVIMYSVVLLRTSL
jgi:hypothetical protein